MSWLWYVEHDPDQFDASFRERYFRPAPWVRLLDEQEVEEIAWKISSRLGTPARKLTTALDITRQHIHLSSNDTKYMGWTEPLSSAAPRFGFDKAETVLFVPERPEAEGSHFRTVGEISLTDMIAFEEMLWPDKCYLIDPNGRWIVWGPHDYACQFLRLRGD